jgi:hypothetical protein
VLLLLYVLTRWCWAQVRFEHDEAKKQLLTEALEEIMTIKQLQ